MQLWSAFEFSLVIRDLICKGVPEMYSRIDHSFEVASTKHLSRDFWLIWWTPFDQFGSQWHGVTFIRKWVKQEIHKPIDRIPWKGFFDWIGTPKKHYIIWCLGTIQVPLIGITDAVSMVLWLGLLVRVLAIIAKCADCHAIHIQINTWIEYFYPGQKIFRSKYQWNISIQDKNIQINTQIEYSYPGQKIFRSKHNLNISIQYKRYSDQHKATVSYTP